MLLMIQEKMGKKAKKKARNSHNDKKVSSDSPKNVSSKSKSNDVTSTDKVLVATDRRICPHLEKGVNFDVFKAKFESSVPLKCEDCRDNVDDRRSNNGRGKHGKKKGDREVKSESKSIWICLSCGLYLCGGAGLPTTPQSHVIRHSKQSHHQITVELENPQHFWCFACSTLLHPEKPEDGADEKVVLHNIEKMIKQKPAKDVEEIWFGSSSVLSGVTRETCPAVGSDGKGRNAVRGMLNLGNTCFFNSVMQSLLALDQLCHYFLKLDVSPGPLTSALKKLAVEFCEDFGSKSAINPKAFLGSVCSKAPQFSGYQQQDSHEFLRCLLDGLSTEELSAKKKMKSAQEDEKSEPTFVEAMFGGQLCSIVTCVECEHSSIVHEPFLDLSLPLPTRKPPSKKSQPVAGTRKPKLPPRKNGKNRPKLRRDSSAPPSCRSVDNSLLVNVSSAGLSTISKVENTEPKHCIENNIQEQAVPEDFAWLDYLDDDTVSSTNAVNSGNPDVPLNQEHAAEKEGQNDVAGHDSTGSSGLKNEVCPGNAESLVKLSLMDDDVGERSFDFHDLTSQVNEKLVTGDPAEFFAKESNNISTEALDVFKPSDSLSKEDTPLLIEDNTVLLLPYEPILRTEGDISTSSLGYEQDSVEFDGLGGLFDEPEDAGTSGMNSSAVDNPFEAIKTAEAVSESEPDEVDNSNAPITVERCLSYFIKSELLTKKEHAWQCENCSKLLQEKMRLKRKARRNSLSQSLLNGNEDRQKASSDQLGSHQTVVSNGVSHLSNGNINRESLNNFDRDCVLKNSEQSDVHSGASQCEETKGDLNVAPVHSSNSSCQDDNIDQLNGNNKRGGDLDVDKPDATQGGDSFSASGESEASEDEKTDPVIVKVERDANKRILINKVPRVLTIHLKRFGQDTRGRLSKLTGHVKFHHTIDLKPYIDPRCTGNDECKYSLVGVVEHIGTMRGGHYIAYVRGKSTKNMESNADGYVWYNANDAYVRESSLEEVLSSDAYILFYERI